MVGKSNKFDFSNRSSTGVKLGHVVAEAFRKEVDKTKKDADRQATRRRKRSSEGFLDTGKDIGIHIIDFKAPNKDLGDAGILAFAAQLEEAILAGSEEASICLEDVNLSGNSLTIASLACLAPVIQAARYDLKTLNLSDNKICVNTPEDAAAWEQFLTAFEGCVKLRRLDFANNRQLGAKALEILARVYESESPIAPLRLGGDLSVQSLVEALDEEDEGSTDKPRERTVEDGQLLKRRCGIRSLPYLNLSGTGLDDACALWLSFVLPQHYYPDQLISSVNGTHAVSSITVYQQAHNSSGIDWDDNEDTLGKDGLQLLHKVELSRRHTLHDNMSVTSIDSDAFLGDATTDSQTSLLLHSVTARKMSGRIRQMDDEGDINAIRHKIQRQILQRHGVKSVDLWRAAIRVICLSRRLFIVSRVILPFITRRNTKLRTPAALPPVERAHIPTFSKAPVVMRQGLVVTDISNGKTRDQYSKHGKPSIRKKLEEIKIVGSSKIRYMEWQEKYHNARSAGDSGLPWVVPFAVFNNIMAHVLTKDEMRALNVRQQRAAYQFGQSRSTLTLEREWMRMNESAQILMLLDHVRCLAYEGR